MNEDMSEMLMNFSKMMNGEQEMPENIRNMLNSMTNNTSNSSTTQKHNSTNNQKMNDTDDSTSSRSKSNNSSTNNFSNIDMNTIIKIQQIMNSMNNTQNDSRTNLLLSLKPYLKESRKSKVDQYIQLMKMGKIFEIMNPLGNVGDDKKNV
ncbi:MAG: hypothetical protein IJ690_02120 [Clostridia bacterium]|nr:hypothetical protein [Clostridia bacterium]